ncbi:MAG TPA: hypothetical protein VK902_24105, partial [Rubrobacter sp.]|nr:hypothetical protein [Rubrobacter sp.]
SPAVGTRWFRENGGMSPINLAPVSGRYLSLGMNPQEAKRLKDLEKENARLKKLVAEQALDIDMLKEVSRGNF